MECLSLFPSIKMMDFRELGFHTITLRGWLVLETSVFYIMTWLFTNGIKTLLIHNIFLYLTIVYYLLAMKTKLPFRLAIFHLSGAFHPFPMVLLPTPCLPMKTLILTMVMSRDKRVLQIKKTSQIFRLALKTYNFY